MVKELVVEQHYYTAAGFVEEVDSLKKDNKVAEGVVKCFGSLRFSILE